MEILKLSTSTSKIYLKQLCGTFHFVLIVAVPVDREESRRQLQRWTFHQLKQLEFSQSKPQCHFVSFCIKVRPSGRH